MDTKYAFENQFSELISDILGVCNAYVEGRAEKIYVYLSNESNLQYCGCFYKINGRVVRRGKLNTALQPGEPPYDEQDNMQHALCHILQEDWMKMGSLFRQYERPVPTEIRMIYDVATGSPDVRMQYEPVWSKKKGGFPLGVELEWFAQEDAAAGGSGEIPHPYEGIFKKGVFNIFKNKKK